VHADATSATVALHSADVEHCAAWIKTALSESWTLTPRGEKAKSPPQKRHATTTFAPSSASAGAASATSPSRTTKMESLIA